MRKIRIFEHISLDGVIQPGAPDSNSDFANGGWTAPYRSPDGAKALLESQGKGFDLLLGRRTYDLWSGYWPKQTSSNPFAEGLNAAKKYVATHRPESLQWGPVGQLGADALQGIRRVKSEEGPDLIIWGSSTLTTALLEQALIDEMVLVVYPVLLGTGTRCFSNSGYPREFALVSTKSTPSGAIINTYRYVGSILPPP